MSEYVSEDVAQRAAENGAEVGRTEPSRETKGSWWQVYAIDGELIACVFTGWGASCGERITADELPLYTDDPHAALEKFNTARAAAAGGEGVL